MKRLIHIVLVFVFLAIHVTVLPHAQSEELGPESKLSASPPENIIAQMSDEQVRRMLIEELKIQANEKNKSSAENQSKSALVRFIQTIRGKVALVQERIEFLKAGEKSEDQPGGFFSYFSKGKVEFDPSKTFFSLLAIFIGAFIVERIFFRYVAPLRGRLVFKGPVPFRSRLGQMFLILGIESFSILIFIAVSILCFHLFFGRIDGLRLFFVTYLAAIVIVRLVMIISRFFLVPNDSKLRFLPMGDDTARYLYRWIVSISIVASFGLLTCGIFKLSGVSDVKHFKAVFLISIIIMLMLDLMILMKRKQVVTALLKNLPDDSLRAKLAQKWHLIAIFFVFILFIASTSNMLLGTYGEYLGLKTLSMIPLYFLADWILLNILDALFVFIPQEEAAKENIKDIPEETEETEAVAPFEFGRIKQTIVSALRWALLALFLVWTFNLWGIELPIGKAVARAAFNILAVVLVCYVVWEYLNTVIQKRLKAEMPEEEEEMEEGGAGGSRVGTLLLLLRKFLMIFILTIAVMITLSAMGVNIGPLIAGAGVVGLAIGFGAQTLVKDIISGVFFLIDDAFRVGDFIEVGTTKGLVEQISIRSFKIRHPRGMLNTIPFGDISSVTNFSRDYIITKLDFRVRYDTDVEKVRKIIKKDVYKVILKNEKLGPKLLGKIKSQGVRQLEDSAMIMRVKFKTIPGEQFGIRKEVYRLLQEAFKENGVEFAHKNVTVYIPPETEQSFDGMDKNARRKLIEASAAAAAQEQTSKETGE